MEIMLYILTFVSGFLSVLSPCILSLIPIYMSYLSFGAKTIATDGTITYNRKKVMIQTFYFIFGICTTFFILGFSFGFLGQYISKLNKEIQIFGGILIIFLGLFQLGLFKIPFLSTEKRIAFSNTKCSPLIAYITGFVFSFAWTPCVGPSLTTILVLIVGNENKFQGFFLMTVYALGFIIPFILLGLFTSKILNLLKKYRSAFVYISKVSGGILLLVGSFLFIKGILSTNVLDNKIILNDQYSNTYSLKTLEDKKLVYIFLSTWCSVCKIEMEHIKEIYKHNDFNIVGVMNPKTQKFPFALDSSNEDVLKYIKKNNYNFPIILDTTGVLYNKYQIKAFPTYVFIDKNSNLEKKYIGGMGKDKLNKRFKLFYKK